MVAEAHTTQPNRNLSSVGKESDMQKQTMIIVVKWPDLFSSRLQIWQNWHYKEWRWTQMTSPFATIGRLWRISYTRLHKQNSFWKGLILSKSLNPLKITCMQTLRLRVCLSHSTKDCPVSRSKMALWHSHPYFQTAHSQRFSTKALMMFSKDEETMEIFQYRWKIAQTEAINFLMTMLRKRLAIHLTRAQKKSQAITVLFKRSSLKCAKAKTKTLRKPVGFFHRKELNVPHVLQWGPNNNLKSYWIVLRHR